MDERIELAAAVLEKRADADSLAAAALLRSLQRQPAHAVDLLARAIAVAPERADLVWLEIRICREVSTCDVETEEIRLRVLDPTNGAGWFNALARADASQDDAARLTMLAALGHSERVDLYWTTLIVHLTRAVAGTQKVPLSVALVDVIGILAAQAIPGYRVPSNLCKGDRLKSAEVLQDCRGVALAFERGDTNPTEMVGVAIAKRVWPVDSEEWKRAAEARRVYDYRSQAQLPFDMIALSSARQADRYLALCAQNRREQDVLRSELVDEGKNPDPP